MKLRSLVASLVLVAACTRTLSQTNDDGVTGSFDGKVLRSTHPAVAAGGRCAGTLSRDRASPTARVVVRCADRVMYDGTGAFTLDVRNPAIRDDDASAFEDALTSDRDATPALRITGENSKPDGSGGTLVLWDTGYEIAIAL